MRPVKLYDTFELPIGYKYGSGSRAVFDRKVEATVHAVQLDDKGRPFYRIEFVDPRTGTIKSTWISHLKMLRAKVLARRRRPWRGATR